MTDTILAAHTWPTNAALIADVAKLYLNGDDRVLDMTYGRGLWWKLWRPEHLTTNDRYKPADVQADFRTLPFVDGAFDAVTFDPPYVAPGGRSKSTLPDFNDRYGLHTTPKKPADLQAVINAGLVEAARVVKPRGLVLVKCCDYINACEFWPGTLHTANAARDAGLHIVDRFEHVSKAPRPQPRGRRQVHGRRNLSTLFVFANARSFAWKGK